MRKLYHNITITILSVLFIGFLIQGCQEHSTAPPDQSSKETAQATTFTTPTLKNNSLAFNSSEDFKGFIQELQEQPAEELNTFVQTKVKGFTSLKQAKEQIKKSKTATTQEEEILQLNVADPNFASILNENGVFQIEDRVFKITNKYTYIFKNREAFDSFEIPKNKVDDPTTAYIEPCNSSDRHELTQIQNDVYRAENCGTGGGGGGYDPGDDDNTDPDVEDLDPNENLDIDYPAKRTKEYRSGGTKGRLKGKSWNQYFAIFSSVGTKTEHQRHTWGRWWDRTANEITLDAFINYSYSEKNISFLNLKKSFTVKLGKLFTQPSPYIFSLEDFLTDVVNMNDDSVVYRTFIDAASGYEFTIKVTKTTSRGEELFTYNIGPEDIVRAFPNPKVKYDAKRIRKTFDWSTAVINYPPGIKDMAVEFKLHILRAKHTLKHDGYHLGFITDKRE